MTAAARKGARGAGPAAALSRQRVGRASILGVIILLVALLYGHGELASSSAAFALLLVVSGALLLGRGNTLMPLAQFPILAAFLAFLATSVFWSQSKYWTMVAVAKLAVELIIGLWLGQLHGRVSSVRTVGNAFLIFGIVSLVAGLLNAEIGANAPDGGWWGLASSKNELGMFAAFALAHSSAYGSRGARLRNGAVFGLLLVLSQSATAILAGTGALVAELLISKVYLARSETRPSRNGRPVALIATAATLAALIWFAADRILAVLGKDTTLTRRTDIWTGLLEYPNGSRLVGSGYGAQLYPGSDQLAVIQAIAGPTVHTAHNGFIPVFLGLGWIGLALFVGALVSIAISMDALRRKGSAACRGDIVFAAGALVTYLVIASAEDATLARAGFLCLMIAVGRVALRLRETSTGDGADDPTRSPKSLARRKY